MDMTKRYRLFRRGGLYYSHDAQTGKQASLRTADKGAAQRLLNAKNESSQNPHLNLAWGRVYLAAHDPKLVTRTWSEVMAELSSHGREPTQARYQRAFKSKAFDRLRCKPLAETTSSDFLAVIKAGRPSTNHYLRRLHNLALGLGWLAWPILA